MEITYDLILEKILELDIMGLLLVDKNGKIYFNNNTIEDMFLHKASEVIEDAAVREFLDEYIEYGTNDEDKIGRFELPYGTIMWYKVAIVTVEEAELYLMLFYDMTDSYESQIVLESELTLGENIFLYFDIKDRVLNGSRKAVEFFGLPSVYELMGFHYTTLLYSVFPTDVVDEVFERLHEENEVRVDTIFQYRNERKKFEIRANSVYMDGKKVGMAMYIEPKKIEEEDNRYITKLPDPPVLSKDDLLIKEAIIRYSGKTREETLEELKDVLETYEYIEINNRLEELFVLGNPEDMEVLQKIQDLILQFNYEEAMRVFVENFEKEQ